ncbi:CPCC family cysteine-rich protein [Streptomyces sp. NPDC090994]|uniref:CPCC family cysteine-rich protein n=1 Tax=Streptomyces sp. NPDC090994 TaxID=3365969 RepID=UPI00380A82FB
MNDRCPCPCCGHRVLDAMPGSYEICPVCFWEDDGVQFRQPTMGGGANQVSLIKAQRNHQDFGACDQFIHFTRSSADAATHALWTGPNTQR